MKNHPYRGLPDHTRWSRGVANVPSSLVDPAVGFPFQITSTDLVATAGSCFAQHISKRLSDAGFHYFVAEQAHPIATQEVASSFHYGIFSARYGNIYTTRQLVQLIDRAFGRFVPQDNVWIENDRLFDPFRPAVEPGGFENEREYYLDRERHFSAVRLMFSHLNYFIFTLGLTECWRNIMDGAVYPMCPGTTAGVFNSSQHNFYNQTVDEVISDLETFVMRLNDLNPSARIILTVSPVPLAATALNRHILVSTTYSKSVLRVAAETVVNRHSNVAYFPSYEIITGNFSRGEYYHKNLRDVLDPGVEHVMRLFLKHATGRSPEPPIVETPSIEAQSAKLAALICEEAALDIDVR